LIRSSSPSSGDLQRDNLLFHEKAALPLWKPRFENVAPGGVIVRRGSRKDLLPELDHGFLIIISVGVDGNIQFQVPQIISKIIMCFGAWNNNDKKQ